ncbi:hypothetical protein SADUNF_Sadunf13G0071500 [Salix dunnii]|uniref:glycerol-3-phosphate dehydrogenase (NAD(+)) n=1 Tax=Salix dunnii TaxID=1413687 RepID=A0A835MUW0_9ROSI|nr:hypothetical protein SADUNF_Sadunf13G0071500 [Salix dunnii]
MAALLLEAPPPPFLNCNYHPFLSSSKTSPALHYFPSKIPPPLTFTPTPTYCFLPTVTSSSIPKEEKEEPHSIAVANTKAPDERSQQDRRKVVQIAWEKLVRWSRSWRSKNNKTDHLERTNKVVVLGGGSFGTAMAAHVAYRNKYFPEHKLPDNVIATTNAEAALLDADYCFHAVPVQFSSSFLEGIAEYVDPGLPFISLSKGLELNTLRMMSQIIPQALGNPCQPFVSLSGPSFALELMNKLPTAMVAASKDKKLAHATQQLLASSLLRISTSRDVTGVEIAGALKNVLAIAAGIVEGMNLGNNSMAALVAQGCSEIRWLATKIWVVSPVLYLTISSPLLILKMGAKPATITGLSGTGDIMLTCFVNLSRNRTVGVRLGSGEKLDDILSSMNQVAEGVSTAGAVIALAQKYNVKMPVLTAVARIIDDELTPKKAVLELMSLPQRLYQTITTTYAKPFEGGARHTKFWIPTIEQFHSSSRASWTQKLATKPMAAISFHFLENLLSALDLKGERQSPIFIIINPLRSWVSTKRNEDAGFCFDDLISYKKLIKCLKLRLKMEGSSHKKHSCAEMLSPSYKLAKTLGYGSFGEVKLAEHKLTGLHVAIKILNHHEMEKKGDGRKSEKRNQNLENANASLYHTTL